MPDTPEDESSEASGSSLPEDPSPADDAPAAESFPSEETSTSDAYPASEPAVSDIPVVAHPGDGAAGSGTVLAAVALVVAVVAVGLAGWALFTQSSDDEDGAELVEVTPEFTEVQHSEAKSKACSAFNLVRRGVTINTNQPNPGGPEDITGALAVAANARVSLYDGGQYLLARIDPATPDELAEAVGKFGDLLLDIGAAATAGVTNSDPDQAARLREADGINKTIVTLCG